MNSDNTKHLVHQPLLLIVLWLIVTLFMLGQATSCHAKTPTPEQLTRLAQFEHLVDYFCSFEFFRPDHTVNPDFINALILAESAGNPKALSHKKAKGLTQILYSTGKEAADCLANSGIDFQYVDELQLANLESHHLNDPAINILLACYLVSKYNYGYGGRLELVVTAWNAGESTIKNGQPPNFKETKGLIYKINSYLLFFQQQKEAKARPEHPLQVHNTG